MKFLYLDLNENTNNPKFFQDNYLNVLSNDEIKRANSFAIKNRKYQFIFARILLRKYLSKLLNKSCNEININVANNGAILINETYKEKKLFASISHSEDKIIVVVDFSPVGVDIEYKKERKNFAKLARVAFNNEKEILKIQNEKNLELQKDLFYNSWTKKEALYKLNSLLENYKIPIQEYKVKTIRKHIFDNYQILIAKIYNK